MRDNIIVATKGLYFDSDDFCSDLVGRLCEGKNEVETKGMVAWSHTWSPCGWEVTVRRSSLDFQSEVS